MLASRKASGGKLKVGRRVGLPRSPTLQKASFGGGHNLGFVRRDPPSDTGTSALCNVAAAGPGDVIIMEFIPCDVLELLPPNPAESNKTTSTRIPEALLKSKTAAL